MNGYTIIEVIESFGHDEEFLEDGRDCALMRVRYSATGGAPGPIQWACEGPQAFAFTPHAGEREYYISAFEGNARLRFREVSAMLREEADYNEAATMM